MSRQIEQHPFVLKFNRWSMESYTCLKFWMALVSNTGRQCFVLQDLWRPEDAPHEFKGLLKALNCSPLVRTTNYEKYASLKFARPESKHWARAAAANLTAFDLVDSEYFWLIDADDTVFLTDPKVVMEKLCLAEELAFLKKLDGFSYAFYRHLDCNHWSLGIALMRRDIAVDEVINVPANDVLSLGINDNLDGALDVLRRRGRLNLQSFIFSNIAFHHHTPNVTKWNVGAAFGVYDWRGRVLGGVARAPDDVMVI